MIDTDMCHREPVSVRVEELTRAFGNLVAVDHLNFDIPAGRMTGFVGANGAGKTTTMRMIGGVLKPTSGQVLWSGRPITAEDRRTIGYMPEEREVSIPSSRSSISLSTSPESRGHPRRRLAPRPWNT